MAAEIDAEGEIVGERGGKRGAVGFRQLAGIKGIGIDFGAEDVVLGEGMAPLDTDVRREQAAETPSLGLQGEGAVERSAIERHEVAGIEQTCKGTEVTDEVGSNHAGTGHAEVEGPQMAALLPAYQGADLGRECAEHATASVPLQAYAHTAVGDGLRAQIRDVLFAAPMLNEDVDGDI